ncbi:transcriptional regulator [Brucella anthropi]|uniref:type IV toxin-antitoxin system AbiEi family antitoxin domain-containing protein n=1 Tax=Brucella anthropi TaxID=529 RepID=UPI00124E6C81|nr:AbiEi antitoxin N-terminal domain-containing protein [Brucella anthropi]KAB2790733.1 transcriptional regulator [Brucella anthropi]QOD63067.1 type IV toxin-antitoxin system AbiEi family antitoxin domain-containing protein [Ochrobactrum sp. MT180101]
MPASTQHDKLREYLATHPIARAYELRAAGIFAMTIARAVDSGELIRLSRGLYQRPDADLDTLQALAEAAKLIPQGVVALTSALAFHGLTDQVPREVWMAVSTRDWSVAPAYPPIRITEFKDAYMKQGVELHAISGISVPIFSVPKTLADAFRSKLVDRSVAIEALRATLQQRKASPAAIIEAAMANGAWKKMKAYLEALTSNG